MSSYCIFNQSSLIISDLPALVEKYAKGIWNSMSVLIGIGAGTQVGLCVHKGDFPMYAQAEEF